MPGDQVHVRVDLPHAGRRLRPRRARQNGSGRGNRPARSCATRVSRQPVPGRRKHRDETVAAPRPRAVRAPPQGARPRPGGDSAAGNSVFFSPGAGAIAVIGAVLEDRDASARGSRRAPASACSGIDRERERHASCAAPARAAARAPDPAAPRRRRATRTRPCARRRASAPAHRASSRHAALMRFLCAAQRAISAALLRAPSRSIPPAAGRGRAAARSTAAASACGVSADSSTTSSRPRSAKQRARKRLLGFGAARERHHDRARAGLHRFQQRVVAGLADRQRAVREQRREIRPRRLQHDAAGALRQRAKALAVPRAEDCRRPARARSGRASALSGFASIAASSSRCADRAAARGDDDFVRAVAPRVRGRFVDDVSGVVQLLPAMRARRRKRALEARSPRDRRAPARDRSSARTRSSVSSWRSALFCAAQDVAHRADDRRAAAARSRGQLEQRQQFEAHLPAAERKQFEHQHVRIGRAPGVEQGRAAPALPCVVDRAPGLIHQGLEAQIGRARRRQLHEVHACPAAMPGTAAPPLASVTSQSFCGQRARQRQPPASGGRSRAGAGRRRRHACRLAFPLGAHCTPASAGIPAKKPSRLDAAAIEAALAGDESCRRAAQPRALAGIEQQFPHQSGEGRLVAARRKQPGAAVLDHVRHAARGAGNHRQPAACASSIAMP